MKPILAALAIALALTACNSQKPASDAEADGTAVEQAAPAVEKKQRDISTETLVKIDPDIQTYADHVDEAKAAFEASGDKDSKEALIAAYVEFGDYMQYTSNVSPRQGKYYRALVEYRHARDLDPDNVKVQGEIDQIEGIYRSMGRPIPGS
jgi:hypothetical protein